MSDQPQNLDSSARNWSAGDGDRLVSQSVKESSAVTRTKREDIDKVTERQSTQTTEIFKVANENMPHHPYPAFETSNMSGQTQNVENGAEGAGKVRQTVTESDKTICKDSGNKYQVIKERTTRKTTTFNKGIPSSSLDQNPTVNQ